MGFRFVRLLPMNSCQAVSQFQTALSVAEATEKVRADRWLWAVRLFKTRGLAAEACRGGKVRVGEERIKPSRKLVVGELLQVQKDDILREVRVLAPIQRRVGAPLVPEAMEDLTPPERFEARRETLAQAILRRESGTGRPTKRDRRDIDRLFGD